MSYLKKTGWKVSFDKQMRKIYLLMQFYPAVLMNKSVCIQLGNEIIYIDLFYDFLKVDFKIVYKE